MMMIAATPLVLLVLVLRFSLFLQVSSHASIWHPSMWGFNVTEQTFPYDNRPVAPLINYTFAQWWFHGHLGFPPNDGDIFELPAGQNVTTEVACDKSATTFFASSDGGNIQNPNAPNDPCPGSPPSEYHTTGISDVKGCALAIAYKANVSDVQPADFAVFTVNQTCVWNRFTDWGVPKRMPPCPDGGCICAFFWIHSPDSGSEQNYMNGFRCNVTGSTSTTPVAQSKVARRCGEDPTNLNTTVRTFVNTPGNCTYGAKQPFYWDQAEQNNMFEGVYAPPFYNDLYHFTDGAQEDIFEDSYVTIPPPSATQTLLPVLRNFDASTSTQAPTTTATKGAASTSTSASAASTGTASATSSAPTSASSGKCRAKSQSAFVIDAGGNGQRRRRSLYEMSRTSRRLLKRSDLWSIF